MKGRFTPLRLRRKKSSDGSMDIAIGTPTGFKHVKCMENGGTLREEFGRNRSASMQLADLLDVGIAAREFHGAVRAGDDKAVQRILSANPTLVNLADEDGRGAMHIAVEEGWMKTVRVLMANGAEINGADSSERAPLTLALTHGQYRIANELLNVGQADPNGRTQDDSTRRTAPLHVAAAEGNPTMISYLLSRGADIDLTDEKGNTAIMNAIKHMQEQAALELLRRGASLVVVNDDGESVADMAQCSTACIRSAVFQQMDIPILNLLAFAMMKGDRQRVETQIERLHNINHRSRAGKHALHYACTSRVHVDLLKSLMFVNGDSRERLRDGIDLNAIDQSGLTPFAVAAGEGQLEHLRLLVVHGAIDPHHLLKSEAYNLKSRVNGSHKLQDPLQEAAVHGQVDVIRFLCSELSVDVNRVTDPYDSRRTALLHAIAAGRPGSVAALVSLGANEQVIDRRGNCAVDLARRLPKEMCQTILGLLSERVSSARQLLTITDSERCASDVASFSATGNSTSSPRSVSDVSPRRPFHDQVLNGRLRSTIVQDESGAEMIYDERAKALAVELQNLKDLPDFDGMDEIASLSLAGNRLACADLKKLKELTALEVLDLTDNGFCFWPEAVNSLHLKELVLDDNQIAAITLYSAPLLQRFSMANNKICAVDRALFASISNVTYLDLSNNHIAVLPPEIVDMQQLATFKLTRNDIATLPSGLCKLANLHSLYLEENRVRLLPAGILEMGSLRMIMLTGNLLPQFMVEAAKSGRVGLNAVKDKCTTFLRYDVCDRDRPGSIVGVCGSATESAVSPRDSSGGTSSEDSPRDLTIVSSPRLDALRDDLEHVRARAYSDSYSDGDDCRPCDPTPRDHDDGDVASDTNGTSGGGSGVTNSSSGSGGGSSDGATKEVQRSKSEPSGSGEACSSDGGDDHEDDEDDDDEDHAPEDGGVTAQRAKMSAKRDKVARELLETERTYVNNLGKLVEVWMVPLERGDHSDLVPQASVRQIFGSVKIIRAFNQMLLQELEERIAAWDDTQLIGDVFTRTAVFLKTYTLYVNEYGTALALLKEMNQSPEFVALMKQLAEDVRNTPLDPGKQTMKDFLIMPVQRIPRYTMLLQDLLRNTWEDHPDHVNLKEAHSLLLDVAQFVEDSQEDLHNRMQIIGIQRNLIGKLSVGLKLLQPGRKLIKQGEMVELVEDTLTSRSRRKRRHLFLFSDILLISAPKRAQYKLVYVLPLQEVTGLKEITIGPEAKKCIQVCHEASNTKVLLGGEDRKSWLSSIISHLCSTLTQKKYFERQSRQVEEKRRDKEANEDDLMKEEESSARVRIQEGSISAAAQEREAKVPKMTIPPLERRHSSGGFVLSPRSQQPTLRKSADLDGQISRTSSSGSVERKNRKEGSPQSISPRSERTSPGRVSPLTTSPRAVSPLASPRAISPRSRVSEGVKDRAREKDRAASPLMSPRSRIAQDKKESGKAKQQVVESGHAMPPTRVRSRTTGTTDASFKRKGHKSPLLSPRSVVLRQEGSTQPASLSSSAPDVSSSSSPDSRKRLSLGMALKSERGRESLRLSLRKKKGSPRKSKKHDRRSLAVSAPIPRSPELRGTPPPPPSGSKPAKPARPLSPGKSNAPIRLSQQKFNARMWLRSIRMECYWKVMDRDGFNDAEMIGMVDEEDLLEMGIEDEEHRAIILRAAQLLRALSGRG